MEERVALSYLLSSSLKTAGVEREAMRLADEGMFDAGVPALLVVKGWDADELTPQTVRS